jgi:hypothetical protein
MITVNIRFIRIQTVEDAGSVNIGTTLNIVAQPEEQKDDVTPTPPPVTPSVPDSTAPETPVSPAP